MTTAERAMDRLAKGITNAFQGMAPDAGFGRGPVPILVRCETTTARSMGFAGTGLKITIVNRTATFDADGNLVGTVDETEQAMEDRRKIDMEKEAREEAAVKLRRAEAIKRGDFSKVDWGGSR